MDGSATPHDPYFYDCRWLALSFITAISPTINPLLVVQSGRVFVVKSARAINTGEISKGHLTPIYAARAPPRPEVRMDHFPPDRASLAREVSSFV